MVFFLQASDLRRAGIPVAPGSDEARRWARDELAKQVYEDAKPGWVEQLGAAVLRALAKLLDSVGVAPAHTGLIIVGALVLVAAVVLVLILRPRLHRKNQPSGAVFATSVALSAAEHRSRAQAAAAAADFYTAVTEQFRAMVRAAEERDVSQPAPGRTAVEVAAELERAFFQQAGQIHRSAELFNAVRYGQVRPTAEMFAELLAVDKALAVATPVYPAAFEAAQP